MRSGSSHPHEWGYRVGAEVDSGVGTMSGAAAVGIYHFFSFLLFVHSGLSFSFHLSAGMNDSGGGALPSSPLARTRSNDSTSPDGPRLG